MVDFVKEYYVWGLYAVALAGCAWNGIKVELSIGNKLYCSCEVKKFKGIMRYF